MLTLNAIGAFSLRDGHGQDFSPRGSKARGLIVLLAVAPGQTRTRTWLQSRLWSDRSPGQAAGSLRSVLAEIRQALGPHRDLLQTNRQSVTLDARGFKVSYASPDAASSATEAEPFEDVDIADREFENLIRDLRHQIKDRHFEPAARPLARRRFLVFIKTDAKGSEEAHAAARLFADRLSALIRDIGDIDIIGLGSALSGAAPPPVDAGAVPLVEIYLLAVGARERVFLSYELVTPTSRRKIWAENSIVPADLEALHQSVMLDRMALTAVERLCELAAELPIPNGTTCSAALLAREAMALHFRLDRDSLVQADRLLSRAFEMESKGVYLAWRSFIRNSAIFQHREAAFFDDTFSATDFATEALRHSPEDPFVKAVAGQIEYIYDGCTSTALRLAEGSVDINGINPMNWALLSNALLTNGRREESYMAAKRALDLSAKMPTSYYFEHFACMAAAALNNYDQARLHAKTALRLRPDFVSSRRYEIALAMHDKDEVGLARAVESISRQEPDFTPQLLLSASYPCNTLRRLPLAQDIA